MKGTGVGLSEAKKRNARKTGQRAQIETRNARRLNTWTNRHLFEKKLHVRGFRLAGIGGLVEYMKSEVGWG
jgi:hypothetical protein